MYSKPKIYLTDLRHITGGVISNTHMPLGIAYMKAVMDRELPSVESKTFADPHQLLEAIKTDPPDVLMLTNYVWNERLSRYFTKVMKRIRQESLVVAGGPNVPLKKESQIQFFKNWDDLDVYALGEGDFLATDIVSRYLDAGKSVAKFKKNGLSSSIYGSNGQVICQPIEQRNLDLANIPSPWLTGVQDHFFIGGKFIPMVETNRGCPFKCTFCVQGTSYYNRMAHIPIDQVKEELTYIARRIKKVSPAIGGLCIADPNFSMFKRDVDISAHIGELQKDYSWPNYVACSTGKNAPELIVKSLEKTNGALEMLHAVQSMDATVLKSIKRSNIKLDTYQKVTSHLKEKGFRTFSQTILGLPLETIDIHLAGLRQLIDAGIDDMQNFALILLKGCEMESENDRDEYGFKTKFRLAIRAFGEYDSTPIFDVEEVVISTKTLSFDDYLQARKYHIGYRVFWCQDWFNDIFYYAKNLGIKFSSCAEAMIEAMNSDEGAVGKFIQEFMEETNGELFSTPEECIRFYSDENNFKKLKLGEIGDNLINKYRAISSFLIWPHVCKLAAKAAKELIISRASNKLHPEFDRFWEDLCCFVEAKHASGSSMDEILTPVSLQLQYDIPQWVADGHPNSLAPYKLETPQNFLFKLSETGSRELKKAMDTFSVDLLGLAKVVRNVKVSYQVRQAQKI